MQIKLLEPKLALFDLDGTLIHHEHEHFYTHASEVYTKLGHPIPEKEKFFLAIRKQTVFKDIPEQERTSFIDAFWDEMYGRPFPIPREIEGALHCLEHLASSGCKIAIVTARLHLPNIVEQSLKEHTLLADYFSRISTLADPGLLDKHAGALLKKKQILSVCKEVRVAPDKSMIVGDSPSDISSGHAAGLALTVAVRTGGIDEQLLAQANPHILTDSVAELPEKLHSHS